MRKARKFIKAKKQRAKAKQEIIKRARANKISEQTEAIDEEKCPHCHGAGQINEDGMYLMDCHHCHGTGISKDFKKPVVTSGRAQEDIKPPKSGYEDHKVLWKKWWKPLLEVEDVPEQVMKELADYKFILDQVSAVYCQITNGKLSKPNYHASTIISEYEQDLSDNYLCREDIEEIINDDNLTPEQKVQEIMKYLY
jgi:hypothetical protein